MVRKIRQAAVIGSGVMGGGIAAHLAGAGIKTLLLDIVPIDLEEAQKNDPTARNRIVKAGFDGMLMSQPPLIMQKENADLITIGNLEDDFEKLADCDWIVEVVVENLKIKQALLKRIETVRKKDAIVSTNTSGIPLKAMSKSLGEDFCRHFLGTHFFNPVRYMRLLEIIPGKDTLPDILEFMADFGERILGKTIVWAKDTPNFVANRIGVQGIVSAMRKMPQDGLTIPQVDALLGAPMGRPKTAMFKTADLVGLDTLYHVAQNSHELVADEKDRQEFKVPEYILKMVAKNLLGNKSGGGFYKKERSPEGKTIRKVIDVNTLEYAEVTKAKFPCLDVAQKAKTLPEKIKTIVYGDDTGARFVWKTLAANLIYSADRIPEIAATIVEVDKAMRAGFNFTYGPFETWDIIGVKESVEKMESDGFTVPKKVKAMLAAGNDAFYKIEKGRRFFYDFESRCYQPVLVNDATISLSTLKSAGQVVRTCKSASLIDLGDDVMCLEFHTKMNAINAEIIDFIGDALDVVDANAAGLVIGNQAPGVPGAFSVGGDLVFMSGLAKEGKYSEIDAFIKRAQQGLLKTRYTHFPIVAAPFGMTLGGGCEICIGGPDKIVAHSELYMGLVEIGVGLLPAGGGCLSLWRKMTANIPQAAGQVDLKSYFAATFMAIGMAKVSTSAADAYANGILGPKDRIVFNWDHLIGEAKKEVLKMVADGYAPPVKRPMRVMGAAGMGMAGAELFNLKAAGFVSDYDVYLAKRIAFVISGGDVRTNAVVDEEVILNLERETFVDLWQEEKTLARVEHMLKTGRPLRN
jgi:3-hydroxyacyl-CoA dehydrogenase